MSAQNENQRRTAGLSMRAVTWLIFVLMVTTLPTLYFLIQAIAFIPLLAIVSSMFEEGALVVLGGIHVAVFTPLYFGTAFVASKGISRIGSPKARTTVLFSIMAALITLSFFPVYLSGGEGRTQHSNWAGTFTMFSRR